MTSLRQRMIEDMQIRNLAIHTQNSYVLQVSMFARHFGKFTGPAGSKGVNLVKNPVFHSCVRCPEARGIDALPGSKFLNDRWLTADQHPLFREEETRRVFINQLRTEEAKKSIELISNFFHRYTPGTCVRDG